MMAIYFHGFFTVFSLIIIIMAIGEHDWTLLSVALIAFGGHGAAMPTKET